MECQGTGVLIYLFDGLVYGWLAWRSRSLWMPIGFHLANNFALVVLVNERANTDLLQGSPLIVVDKLPSFNFMLIASGLVYLLVVVIINWLITRREKNAEIQQVSP